MRVEYYVKVSPFYDLDKAEHRNGSIFVVDVEYIFYVGTVFHKIGRVTAYEHRYSGMRVMPFQHGRHRKGENDVADAVGPDYENTLNIIGQSSANSALLIIIYAEWE
jgi:hypothetical protein